jgi:hypothetical protein
VRRQQRAECIEHRMVGFGAMQKDQRRPVPAALEGNRGAVGFDRIHGQRIHV